MSTYYIDGISPTSYRIWSDGVPAVNIIVTLNGDPTFMNMNAWDCCKDSNAGTPAAGTDNMNNFLRHLFPSTSITQWATNWSINLADNFKIHITNSSIEEEEIVFERNKIEVTKLNQYFFFNESGLGGSRVAFDKNTMFEIDTGAQHVDEGPGTGNPNYSFPKSGDTLIFSKSFFEFLGFPTLIREWKCTTNAMGLGTDKYTYQITLTDGTTITDPDEIRVNNPDKNTSISSNTCLPIQCAVLILLKELGDVMQTATYLVFIKLAEYLQNQLTEAAATAVQPTLEQVQLLLPIAINDPFYQCLQSKNINYSAIMLTCDNTVHNRNIKLGIPSCITGSHVEKPYTHATHTGRIYLPITDPVEKLKSLLNMEYKLIEINNTTIVTRLTKANTTKKLVYTRHSLRGKEIENNIPNNFNTTEIRNYIDGLTQQALVARQEIHAYITQNEPLLRSNFKDYEYVKNVILGIPNPDIDALQEINGFKKFMCPPIVTPVPPKPDPMDPQASINRKFMKLSLVSLQIPPGNTDHANLFQIIKSELTKVRVDVTNMKGGGKSKQRGGTKDFKKTINLVTKFSASEKFLIFILSEFLKQVTDIISDTMEQLEYIFSMYNICIYMLEYYKNIKFNDLNISEPKYAYFRLYRVLNILAETFTYDITLLNQVTEMGIDPAQSEILTLEKNIDTHINTDVLAYFYEMFEFIDADDRPIAENDAYIWEHCMHKNDAVTNQPIQGSGIYHPKVDRCIATSSIINWLNNSYPNDISQLPDSAFIDPYTRLQYKQNVIDQIKSEYETSKRQHVTTRSRRGGNYSYLSKQFTTNKNKMHNKKLATKTIKYKSQKQKNQRKHKSRKHKSQKQKNRRKHKSRKHKSRMPIQDKAL